MCDESDDLFQLCTVLEEQVEKIIKAFPSNKAPGPDKVSAWVLKDSLPVTLSTITSIMNVSFCSNIFANAWKTAEVSPVLNSGDFEDPSNTRPISLLPILSKVSEKLAQCQFVDYLTIENKLWKTQSGNRKLHSTETAHLHVTDELLKGYSSPKTSVA